MSILLKGMEKELNYKLTENGGIALKSTLNKVYDLFAFGAAYRTRTDEDCIKLFSDAFYEDSLLAIKCLFYLRDCRGGQGERRFFEVCYSWLLKNHEEIALKNFKLIPEFGRWDNVVNLGLASMSEEVHRNMGNLILRTLIRDRTSDNPSLLAKWLPSGNTSSKVTRNKAYRLKGILRLDRYTYQRILSEVRARIRIVETQMSNKEWDKIDYKSVPSIAGLKYRKAFERNDEDRYMDFINDKNTTVKASVLAPYDIVNKCLNSYEENEAAVLDKYWENLPNYFTKPTNSIAVVDVSGSMTGTPMNVAISLGAYVAEKSEGLFKNHFITFSENPQLVKFDGKNIVDKVKRASRADWGGNTDLQKVFDLLLATAIKNNLPKEEMPETLYIISDMEIDRNRRGPYCDIETEMAGVRAKWKRNGYDLPNLVYWNVDARQNTILEDSDTPSVTFVSGMSPTIFEQVLKGVTGQELMLDKLNSERYSVITI